MQSSLLLQQQQLSLLQVLLLLRVLARLQQLKAGHAALVLLAGRARHKPRQLLLLLRLLRAKVRGLMSQTAVMMRAAAQQRSTARHLQLLAGVGLRRLPLLLLLLLLLWMWWWRVRHQRSSTRRGMQQA
jgi:hypothetical protein